MLPIFYINLASRTDRREHVEKQLEALGLSGTRIDAVTPADLAGVDYGQLSASELGCSRSHQKIWQLLVDQDIPAALILEDDVLLSQHMATVLADPRLLDGVDAIQFETRGTSALVGRPVPTPVDGVTRNRLMSSSLGSAAYIMTRHLAVRLLAHPERDNLPLDTFIFGRPGSVFYEAKISRPSPPSPSSSTRSPADVMAPAAAISTNAAASSRSAIRAVPRAG